jgi:peptidoglycan/LPS O-acetylase OafA/YrhL
LARSLSLSWSGVDLFFVLSGFLIGGILLDYKNGRYYFKTFYIRRICRIFPLYFIWLFIFLWAFYTIPPSSMLSGLLNNPLPFWVYLTFTQNIAMSYTGLMGVEWLAVTWSLAIEEQFYLFLTWLIHRVNIRKLPYLLTILILAALCCGHI